MTDVAAQPLVDLSVPISTRRYLAAVWARRDFMWVVPRNDIRLRNQDTVLGQLWHLVNPALMVVVYYIVFGTILDVRRGTENFLVFLVVGILLFQFTQRTVMDAVNVIPRNLGLIRTIQFPRAVLPISTVIGNTLTFIPSMVVIFAVLFLSGTSPTARWLAFIPLFAGILWFHLGASMLCGRLGNHVRDLSQLLPHVFRLLVYASGVLFSIESHVSNETWLRILAINPIYDIVSLARWCLMGLPAQPEQLIGFLAWVVVLPPIGFAAFKSAESRYGG